MPQDRGPGWDRAGAEDGGRVGRIGAIGAGSRGDGDRGRAEAGPIDRGDQWAGRYRAGGLRGEGLEADRRGGIGSIEAVETMNRADFEESLH